MRTDWTRGSAAALVIGGVSLSMAYAISPLPQNEPLAESVLAAADVHGLWLISSMMLWGASIGLALGALALRTLMDRRDRRLRVIAVVLYMIGTIGMSGYAMVLVFLRALVLDDALLVTHIDNVENDPGVVFMIGTWLGCFLLGLTLLAVGMLRARRVPRWAPALMLVFVCSQLVPLPGGHATTVVQFCVLTAAFTRLGIFANEHDVDDARTSLGV